MRTILTKEEVAKAINVEPDFDNDQLEEYAELATSFIKEKTGYDIDDTRIPPEAKPLAKQLARLYIRQSHYGSNGYNKDHDYSLGIAGLIVDVQNIVAYSKQGEQDDGF